ncbi:MAG TPA: ABC transporter permease subunit [Gammaproteobacteria bacterium]
MMHALTTVFRKEFLEAVRDRRVLLSSLVFGPVFAPLLFIGVLTLSLERSVTSMDERVEVTVAGADRAPNLVQFLRQQELLVTLRDGDEEDALRWIKGSRELVVLAVPEGFGEQFRAGRPARVMLYSDGSNKQASKRAGHVHAVLSAYSGTIGAQRLLARGISPTVVQAVAVDAVDVATPAAKATLVLGMLSYIVLLVTLLGGLYLAIDATAGERERGSLEPLLTVPVPRTHIIYGKVLAAAFFMTVALVLVTATLRLSVGLVPLEELGMSTRFDGGTALGLFGATLPLVLAGAALMTVVASFTHSYREAQTWLGVVLLVPTLPIAVAGLLDVKASAALMAVPSLSQHLLIQGFLRDEPLPAGYFAISAGSALLLGALLTWLAGRLYRREAILG